MKFTYKYAFLLSHSFDIVRKYHVYLLFVYSSLFFDLLNLYVGTNFLYHTSS